MNWKPCLSLTAAGVLLASGCYRQDGLQMRSASEEAASKNRELALEFIRLEKRVQELEAENKALRAELKRVRAQLDALRGGGGTRPTGKAGAR